jgi:N-glycosylase/DNA lyase
VIRNGSIDGLYRICLVTPDYDLAATLRSGQAFRWKPYRDGWEGVVGQRWVRLEQDGDRINATTASPPNDWSWLIHYLQTGIQLQSVLEAFPPHDPHLRAAVRACHGLRLLRQEPWECLASFILSSTKRIVQIEQIIQLLCQRYGQPVHTPPGHPAAHAFPDAATIARLSEVELRDCKAGFRATALRAAAIQVAEGSLLLDDLDGWPTVRARERLCELRGVGEKIADCVLLFAFGKSDAFPLDVWIRRALTDLYFRGRKLKHADMTRFIADHFGPQAGYAQQYLFHYVRVHRRLTGGTVGKSRTAGEVRLARARPEDSPVKGRGDPPCSVRP